MIELRALTADDWTIWRELRLAALAEAPYAFGAQLADWQGDGDREERWRARLNIPGSYHVIALLDGEPTGMACGVPTTQAGVVELISMWVRPEARGRGLGDQLIRSVERWAVDADARVLRLAVVEDNHSASALYQRNGFGHRDEPGDLMPDGVRRERIMTKPLGRADGAN